MKLINNYKLRSMKRFLFIVSLMITFVACEDQKPLEGTQMVRDTKSSIFTTVQTRHITGFDIRTTTDTIHNEQGMVVKIISHLDTIPQMGLTRDTLSTGRKYVDAEGDEYEKDTVIVHPRDYQIYISVKN